MSSFLLLREFKNIFGISSVKDVALKDKERFSDINFHKCVRQCYLEDKKINENLSNNFFKCVTVCEDNNKTKSVDTQTILTLVILAEGNRQMLEYFSRYYSEEIMRR